MNIIITKRHLKPGQPGTKALTKIYGEELLCVRYKYDYTKKKRYKTVELIVDETEWVPKQTDKMLTKWFYVQTEQNEADLIKKIKRHGGRRDPENCLWAMRLSAIIKINLCDRIIDEVTRFRKQVSSISN